MTQARFEAAVRRVREDLAARPGVARVSLADKLPLMWNGHYAIEMDEGGQAPTDSELEGLVNGHRISTAAVEPDFFPTFEAARRSRAGSWRRPTTPTRRTSWSSTSRSSRRCSAAATPSAGAFGTIESTTVSVRREQPWLEIVGVVRDMGMAVDRRRRRPPASIFRSSS